MAWSAAWVTVAGGEIRSAMNRVENHAKIEEGFRKYIPLAAKAGVPNVITFSGNREGMSDEEGAKNTIAGLNRVKKIAEDHGVNICIELLNSKVDHHDYMCDHSAWGVQVARPSTRLASSSSSTSITCRSWKVTWSAPSRKYRWIAHFHTGGVPGRHELDATQEVQWGRRNARHRRHQLPRLRRPRVRPHPRTPLTSLRQAADLCDV